MTSSCGYIAIVGRPNVGKSTLLNRLIGTKISITSKKPQTTRYCIQGIKTIDDCQMIFVDTPGFNPKEKRVLNQYMNRAIHSALADVNLVLWVIDRDHWHDEDQAMLNILQAVKTPIVLVINKVDELKDKSKLLVLIDKLREQIQLSAIVPISAVTGEQIPELENVIKARMPEGMHFYPDDQISDRSDRFLAREIIREKLMRFMGEELPYAVHVTLDQYLVEEKIIRIAAVIWVERDSQKAMVIGKGGSKLKKIGTAARLELEKLLEQKVFLQLWVKVKPDWQDREHFFMSDFLSGRA